MLCRSTLHFCFAVMAFQHVRKKRGVVLSLNKSFLPWKKMITNLCERANECAQFLACNGHDKNSHPSLLLCLPKMAPGFGANLLV